MVREYRYLQDSSENKVSNNINIFIFFYIKIYGQP